MTKPLSHLAGQRNDETKILSGPFWRELRVFLAVAKARSFNRAAESLAMSQPTVSRAVRRLQDVMGVQLVISMQTGITLTRQGEELALSLQDLDQKLFKISHDLNAETRNAEGTVRVVIVDMLIGLSVAPVLGAFHELYPDIHLDLCAPVDHTSLRANRGDVMIGIVPQKGSDLVTRQLGCLHMLPVATREYVARYGVPTHSNLSTHCFLQCSAYADLKNALEPWNAVASQGTIAHVCDNILTYAMMVKNGVGIGLVATCALADPAALPLELGVHIRTPLFAFAAAERVGSKAVQIVFDWLSELFSASVPWYSADLKLDGLPQEGMERAVNQLLGGPMRNP